MRKIKYYFRHKVLEFKDTMSNHNLKLFALNGIFFTIMFNLSRAFVPKFLYRIGGTDADISMYNSITGFVLILSAIPAIIISNRSKNKHMTMVKILYSSRFFLIPLAITPMLPGKTAPLVFLLLITVSLIPDAIGGTAFQSFVGDVFESKDRSNALSVKSAYSSFFQICILIFLCIILYIFGKDDSIILIIYQIFFIIAAFFGFLEIFVIQKMHVLPTVKNIKVPYMPMLNSVLKNKNFLIFLVCSMLFNFSWYFGWPIFSVFQVNYLGADEIWLSVLTIVTTVGMLFSFGSWQKLISKKSNSFALIISTFIMATSPLLYIICSDMFQLSIASIPMGVATAGVNICILIGLLECSDEENRLMYVGIHSTLNGLMLFIAPFLSNYINESFGIYNSLFICSLLRFIGCGGFFLKYVFMKK